MQLRHIERGTKLYIWEKSENNAEQTVYEAIYDDLQDLASEASFVVHCLALQKDMGRLAWDALLEIEFKHGQAVYSFTGRAIEKLHGDLIVIEVIDGITELDRRKSQRDEIRVEVRIFRLPEELLSRHVFDRAIGKPVLTDMSFDISDGGLCIITNAELKSESDPYYLIEFATSDRDSFLLPAKLVRRSNSDRTKIGRFDYSFQFIFDNLQSEPSRLTKAILRKKLSFFRRK